VLAPQAAEVLAVKVGTDLKVGADLAVGTDLAGAEAEAALQAVCIR
jgi:hypothetical protein